MPNLRDELVQYLRQWRNDLPTAWRNRLDGVEPNFDAIPRDTSLDRDTRIVPVRRDRGGVFYALEGIDPSDVDAVVIGNDPYSDPARATGRSFEQGDLTEWIADLAEPGRVTPSLLSLVCAAAALLPGAEGLGLDRGHLRDRRGRLQRGLRNGLVVLPPPRSMFENLTGQGVLWINRTPTISVFDSGMRRRGTSWRAIEEQRGWHRRLWRPVTRRIVSVLVEEARERAVVFALFGNPAKELRGWIEVQRRHLADDRQRNLCIVESGHPSVPRYFFCSGNPLGRVNDELTRRGCDPIDWYGPPAGRTVTNDLTRLSTAPQRTLGRSGTSTVRTGDRFAAGASARSIAITDRAVGKYRATLRQLAER